MDAQQRISELYQSFNDRQIDACLAQMTEDVHWPKASESGYVMGKKEIRAYWNRQWAEFDPHVEPVRISVSGSHLQVAVHQVVKSLDGKPAL